MKLLAFMMMLALHSPRNMRAFVFVPPSTAKGEVATTARTTMKVSGIESTPNPSSFKFELDSPLSTETTTRGITYYAGSASSGAPEIIRRVLEHPDVESVYALSDWLCVNKKPSAKWDAIVSVVILSVA